MHSSEPSRYTLWWWYVLCWGFAGAAFAVEQRAAESIQEAGCRVVKEAGREWDSPVSIEATMGAVGLRGAGLHERDLFSASTLRQGTGLCLFCLITLDFCFT